MLVVSGGYEGGIVGLEVPDELTESDTDNYPVRQVFRLLCSQGSIKCMDISTDFMACGGADETVQVYNLTTKKKHGEIMLSEGYITAISIYGTIKNGLLLIGNEYGDIAMYNSRDLDFVKLFKGHKADITGISIYKDSTLFISTSSDGYLRLWDLKSQLCIFNTKLEISPIGVCWSNDGSFYLVYSSKEIYKCSTSDDAFKLFKNDENKYTRCCWLDDKIIACTNSGYVIVYDDDKVHKSQLHQVRIKDVSQINGNIITGDSNGQIVCSKLVHDGKTEFTTLWKHQVGIRLNVLVSR
ncbi:hypothetical protein BEWA_019350 [Theileria equi strain WA]|uniref:Uncharacterized protein n=1 Tax=Theileria equi strain WA TaxID=1537102 RepID=L0AU57_THEEQ|nr:hypothetical protein BEWA_019350 [Theileria equi strain WA]AFZ79090.1 hypothetical protein BEWA_019350 [Theileria equi strain WA]|eukprot:XP_004828756.1 hypothetical protein BEWA_019350 [Theileria equi strain WA]